MHDARLKAFCAFCPIHGLAFRQTKREGHIEMAPHDKLAFQDIDRNMVPEHFGKEQRYPHGKGLFPETLRKRDGPRGSGERVRARIQKRRELRYIRSILDREHLVHVPVVNGGTSFEARLEGKVFLPEAPDSSKAR